MYAWMKAIKALLAIKNEDVVNHPKYDHVKALVYHLLRIMHGTVILRNTDPIVNKKIKELSGNTWDFLVIFSKFGNQPGNHLETLNGTAEKLKTILIELKLSIPTSHLIRSEEPSFSIFLEERYIRWHISEILRSNDEEPDPLDDFIGITGCDLCNM
eukprot:TRINITY_DN2067_c0_g8_i2.p1 TRINITY_DN2067_c0_g8~~TRINITY_DN2067_c0_g8_i2.p1  ORF type:complete len:157 (-),score=25.94 TRINITY_DN2067_c0_g8_i2:117-587(-)